jgi:predicted DNA-binding antitoxin AbrB/MazE fold protein
MTITVEATYENGVLKPKQPLALIEGTEVRLAISLLDEDYDPLEAVIGICTEGPDISLAARHDELLYGLKPREEDHP